MIALIQYRYSDILILYENVFINLIPAGIFLMMSEWEIANVTYQHILS